ncbi:MAG: hypothetical protein ACLR1A_02855 [Eubacterium ventriosum]
MKHTWFQKQAFNEAQGDDEEKEENEFCSGLILMIRSSMIERYRKLERLTVLGALYKSHYLQTIILDLMKNRHIFQIQKF